MRQQCSASSAMNWNSTSGVNSILCDSAEYGITNVIVPWRSAPNHETFPYSTRLTSQKALIVAKLEMLTLFRMLADEAIHSIL